MKKIVFLDEYSIAGRNLDKITSQGEYIAYENTTKEQVVERLKGATIAITNKVVTDGEAMPALLRTFLLGLAIVPLTLILCNVMFNFSFLVSLCPFHLKSVYSS